MKYYVCSYGGCGSKMICSYLENYGTVYHIHSRNPPIRLTHVGGNVYQEWFNFHVIPDKEVGDYTVIYLYRNPIKSIYSRFVKNPGHLRNIQAPDQFATLEGVLRNKKDLFGLESFYDNYTVCNPNRNYKIYCVKYEDFFTNILEFNRVFKLPDDKTKYPIKEDRNQSCNTPGKVCGFISGVPISSGIYNEFKKIYKSLIDKMKQMPFIKEI